MLLICAFYIAQSVCVHIYLCVCTYIYVSAYTNNTCKGNGGDYVVLSTNRAKINNVKTTKATAVGCC